MRAVSDKRRAENREFAKVREFVMERDGSACQFFKGRGTLVGVAPHGGQLDPHHLVTVARDRTLRLEPTNLLTLCRNHHDWVHDHPIAASAFGLLKSAPVPALPQNPGGV